MINIEIVRNYLQAGLAVLPADKVRKCPVLPGWKRYQEELPTESEVHAWFSNHHNALCIVCGKVSGNLEIIDFDNQGELFPAYQGVACAEPGLPAGVHRGGCCGSLHCTSLWRAL